MQWGNTNPDNLIKKDIESFESDLKSDNAAIAETKKWEDDSKDRGIDRHLRFWYAIGLLFILGYIIYKTQNIIYLQGSTESAFKLSWDELRLFMSIVVAKIFGFIFIVVRYLFPLNKKK
ncbi:MAG: hypothetical protein ABUK01_12970 [Leptospirales bacterium]